MILDKNSIYDGWDNIAAGMDAGRRPSIIDENQCAKARDVVFRGGVPVSRPGIRQLALDFQEELYYNQEGDPMGPAVITDAFYIDNGLFSQSAQFTGNDLGSFVLGPGIPVGTKIDAVNGATSVTLDHTGISDHQNETVTIVGRTNPVTFVGGYIDNFVSSLAANFGQADVGRTITGGSLPSGTFIVNVPSPFLAQVNNGGGLGETGITYTIADRFPNPSSTDTFHSEPFQCASYYAPSNGNECIMATFGGRLFQITPSTDRAKVREVALGKRLEETITFSGGHIDNHVLSLVPIFKPQDVGAVISGGNLPDGTRIVGVDSSTIVTIDDFIVPEELDITFSFKRPNTVGRRNRRSIPANYMVQADRWHITQDGESKAIIFDGVLARRAADDEIVVGTIMAYGVGRLVVTRNRDIYFGDLFGSHPGDPSESVIKFTETKFLNEGFPAEIPYTMGNITAASFFPSQDTSTAQGELVIFTDRGAVSFDLHLPREKWKESTFQEISLINSTARGDRCVTMVNSDLWIRSDEGYRAYRQARAQATGWYQLPQSTEVTPWTRADTPRLLQFGSSIYFDNRLIATCNPIPNQGRLYHNGILALDFSVLSSFGQATRPAWDGHWSKLKTLQLVTGVFAGKHRAFAFGLDDEQQTQLYEISVNDREDFDGPITSEIEFRSHDFKSPFNEKQLYGADLWVDDTGPSPLSLELSFRVDSSADYLPWKTISNILPPGQCGEITCGMCPTIGTGFMPRIKVPKPKDDCDDYSGRLIRRGYEFQPKLRWTSHAAIRRMRLRAIQEEEDPKGEC